MSSARILRETAYAPERGCAIWSVGSNVMFNVRPDIDVPGFRFRAPDSTPGFRVNSGSEARPVPSGGGRALLYSNPNAEAAPFSPLDATDRLRYGFSEEDEGKPAEAP